MKTILAVVAFSFVCAGFVAAPNSDPKLDLIKDYRKWTRVTERLQDMETTVALACAPAPPTPRAKPNLHEAKAFLVYVNAKGKSAMLKKGSTAFPDGTVIVKEKYDRATVASTIPGALGSGLQTAPELLTVMYKDHGKWMYFSVNSQGQRQDRDTSHCRSCHEKNKAGDHVFRPYVLGSRSQ